MQSKVVIARIIVTSALMSGENPRRIMAQSLMGKVLSVPVTSSVIMVSSKDKAKLKFGEVVVTFFGVEGLIAMCQRWEA